MRGCIFLILLLSSACFAQQYQVIHFSQKNGMPQNSVNGLFWDRQQMLWISTEDGIVRYDGNRLWSINDTGNSGVLKNRFRWIIPSDHHTGYVAVANGHLYEINGTSLTPVKNKTHYRYLKSDYNTAAEIDWIYSKAGGHEMEVRKWVSYPFRMAHADSSLWVLAKKKVLKYQAQKVVDSIELSFSATYIFHIGKQLMLVSGTQQYDLDPTTGTITAIKTDTVLRGGWYMQPGTQTLFLVNNRRIYSIKHGNGYVQARYILTLPPSVQGDISDLLFNPRLGQFAIGTYSNGLYLLKPAYFSTVNNGLRKAHYIMERQNDSAIIGTDGNIYTINGIATGAEFNLLNINGAVLLRDHSGALWSTKNDSILVQPPGEKRKAMYTGKQYRVKAIVESGDTIVAITCNHILRYLMTAPGRYHCDTVTLSAPVCDAENSISFQVYKGKVLICDERGIFSVDMKTGHVVVLSATGNVWMLAQWRGQLIGSLFNEGLFVFRNNKIVKLPQDQHLFLQKAHQFYESPGGTVFVSTNKGLLKTRSDYIQDYLDGKSDRIPWQYITESDGLENSEFNGSGHPGVVALKNGTVAFANMGGIVWFNLQQVERAVTDNPRLYVSDLTIDDRPVPIRDTIEMLSAEENLTIDVGCVYWGNPLDIRIRYKLEGYMSLPQFTDGQKISFTQLPAGTYQLIMECEAGIGTQRTDKLTLTVIKRPKFYETTWFYLLVACGFLVVVAAGFVIHDKRLIRQNRILEQKVMVRTQELQHSNTTLRQAQEELHQSIRVKNKLISILAHDIVTPLKFISLVAKNFKTTMERNAYAGKEVIDEIYHTSQHLFDNAQNILEWIRYQNNLIRVRRIPIAPYVVGDEITELFADMVSLRHNTISNQIEVEDMVTTDPVILKIILQNLVANAVKHVRNADIVLSSEYTQRGYILTVSDSGQGMSEKSLQRIEDLRNKMSRNTMLEDSSEGTGLGYIIIFEMSALIGAQILIQSEPDKGTIVQLILTQS
jgi:signal transduction histidine kinase/ligand-binding sensor domain-containing protein